MQVFPKNIPYSPVVLSFSTAADQTIVTGVTGQRIYVVKFVVSAAAATNLTFKSAATALSGAIPISANGFIVPEGDNYWWITNPGDNLVINNSAAVAVGGTLWYVQQ